MASKKNITTERTCNRLRRAVDRKRWDESKQQVEAYLAEHPKPLFYQVDAEPGETLRDEMNSVRNEKGQWITRVYLTYTDKEVQRIKHKILDLWNASHQQKAHSFEELNIDDFTPFRGKNKVLDKLLWKRAEDIEGVKFRSIRFDNPRRFYRFSSFMIIEEDEKLIDRQKWMVRLTDEEYLYLLTERQFNGRFSLNRLYCYNPALAQSINDMMYHPEVVWFDEVEDDYYHILDIKSRQRYSQTHISE